MGINILNIAALGQKSSWQSVLTTWQVLQRLSLLFHFLIKLAICPSPEQPCTFNFLQVVFALLIGRCLQRENFWKKSILGNLSFPDRAIFDTKRNYSITNACNRDNLCFGKNSVTLFVPLASPLGPYVRLHVTILQRSHDWWLHFLQRWSWWLHSQYCLQYWLWHPFPKLWFILSLIVCLL